MSAIVSGQLEPSSADVIDVEISTRYAWNYQAISEKVEHLYKLGNEKAWDPDHLIRWDEGLPPNLSSIKQDISSNPFINYEPYLALSETDRVSFDRRRRAWNVSQALHGEQGALLVSSQLVSCLPEYEGKLYAASQAFDEARHVYVFARYLESHMGFVYPINPYLESLIDQLLVDKRWDIKFLGMQVVIEGLALSSFDHMRKISTDPLLLQILNLVLADESRHVNFGMHRLRDYLETLPEADIKERADFAFYACSVLKSQLFPSEVLEEFGMDAEAARSMYIDSSMWRNFLCVLYSKIVPNLQRLGLLTAEYLPKYRELGALPDETAEGHPSH